MGTYIDENLSFAEHSDAIAAAGSRALGRIRHKLYFLKECRSATFTQFYSSCICPILDYWAAIWGDKEFIKIEQVQLRALRYFLGVHRFAPTPMLLGHAGWMTCHSRHKLAALRLWNRLVTLPSTRLASTVFLWDLSFGNKSNTWCNNVGNIFQEIGLPDLYASLEPCDIENCCKLLIEKEIVKWNVTRYNKPKLRLYNMFKQTLSKNLILPSTFPNFKDHYLLSFGPEYYHCILKPAVLSVNLLMKEYAVYVRMVMWKMKSIFSRTVLCMIPIESLCTNMHAALIQNFHYTMIWTNLFSW